MATQVQRVFEVFKTFLKLGFTSFGGPIAHIGYFRREFVERQAWLSESQFSQLLAICQFLPGPASSQLGFAIGLIRAGWLGALAAFLAFTLPSVFLLLIFVAALPYLSGDIGQAGLHGLKLVACAVVADAVLGMAKKLCPDARRASIALLAVVFLLLVQSTWSQIFVVGFGALAGYMFCKDIKIDGEMSLSLAYGKRSGMILCGIFISLLCLFIISPISSELYTLAGIFYQAGALVFGGGHVVLPLLEESVVATELVTKESFLAGYGSAQAIPGPMFAFSAYLGAIMPSASSPLLTAFIALAFMFLPGFLLVSAALPLWRSISHSPIAGSAIAGVNAAVVGVLGATLYDPIFTSAIASRIDLAIVLVAFALLNIWKRSPLIIVIWCMGASIFSSLLI